MITETEVVECLDSLNAMVGGMTDEMISKTAKVIVIQFPRFTKPQVEAGCMKALHLDKRVNGQTIIRALDMIEHEMQNKRHEDLGKHRMDETEARWAAGDYKVSESTRQQLDGFYAAMTDKATRWRNERFNPFKVGGMTHSETYAIARDEFAFAYSDKFAGRDNARKIFEAHVPAKRWNESKDMQWVDEEIGKLIM